MVTALESVAPLPTSAGQVTTQIQLRDPTQRSVKYGCFHGISSTCRRRFSKLLGIEIFQSRKHIKKVKVQHKMVLQNQQVATFCY